MNILACNKFFFLNGGTEKYLHDFIQHFSGMTHTVIPFSVQYSGSWKSPYSVYFLPSPGPPEQIFFRNIRLKPSNIMRYVGRSVYSMEARTAVDRLIRKTGPVDIAYLLNIYNYMSPSILHTFARHRIPVVMRLGDYHLLCPSYLFLREGAPCTLCISGKYLHGVRFRCVKNSIAASCLRAAAMALHRVLGLYDLVDAFVVPCHFMKTKLMEGGFQEKKIYIMRSPVSSSDNNPPKRDRNYMVYFGRISFEKGLETLIRGYQEMDGLPDLVLAGRSYDREQERLERIILPENRKRIRFVGFLEGSQLSELISGALFSVVPSNWYDNSPLSVYESFLHETPVLASDIGGISEQIQDGVTGRLFRPGSVENLKTSLSWMLSDRNRLREMGKAGKMFVRQECSWATHSDQLLSLFQRLIHSKRKKTCAE